MRSEGKVFRTTLYRVAVLPADVVDGLRSASCGAIVAKLAELDEELAKMRDTVSAALYTAIGAALDGSARRRLISLRRDLYNFRAPETEVLDAVALHAPESVVCIQQFVSGLATRDSLRFELEASFETSRENGRRLLRELYQDEMFRRGLLFSSPVLSKAMPQYLAGDIHGDLSAKLARLERSLMRYILRACMKATPFGTFCVVLPGTFVDACRSDASAPQFHGSLTPVRIVTRLGKWYARFIAKTLEARPRTREKLFAELNTEVAQTETHYLILDAAHDHEAFQRIERSPALDIVLSLLKSGESMSLSAWAGMVSSNSELDCSNDEALRYVEQLLQLGVARLHLSVRSQDSQWDEALVGNLDRFDDDVAGVIAESLRTWRDILVRTEGKTFDQARAGLEEAYRVATQLATHCNIEVDPGFPFREDASAKSGTMTVPVARSTLSLIENMRRFVTATIPLAAPRKLQATMRHAFGILYGNRTQVPLYEFYEDFYRFHFKAHVDSLRLARRGDPVPQEFSAENPFSLPFIDTLEAAEVGLAAYVRSSIATSPMAEEVELELSVFERATAHLPAASNVGSSAAMLGQLVVDSGSADEVRFVTRWMGYSLGYGRLMARWLHVLPPEVLEELRTENRRETGIIRAEISGDRGHNANLHPPLLDAEIVYPGSAGGLAPLQLDPRDLLVAVDSEDPFALRLIQGGTGIRVLPHDLGLQSLDERPPLYQLLVAFGSPFAFNMPLSHDPAPPPTNEGHAQSRMGPVAATSPTDGRVRSRALSYRPRLVLGGIVISRRSWLVSPVDLPRRGRHERDSSYFERINLWRIGVGLPGEVYMRSSIPLSRAIRLEKVSVAKGEHQAVQGAEPRSVRSMINSRKPQYVDFDSPLMVSVFADVVEEAEMYPVVIEERYPPASMLPLIDEHPHAFEQVIQFYFPPPTPLAVRQ